MDVHLHANKCNQDVFLRINQLADDLGIQPAIAACLLIRNAPALTLGHQEKIPFSTFVNDLHDEVEAELAAAKEPEQTTPKIQMSAVAEKNPTPRSHKKKS